MWIKNWCWILRLLKKQLWTIQNLNYLGWSSVLACICDVWFYLCQGLEMWNCFGCCRAYCKTWQVLIIWWSCTVIYFIFFFCRMRGSPWFEYLPLEIRNQAICSFIRGNVGIVAEIWLGKKKYWSGLVTCERKQWLPV